MNLFVRSRQKKKSLSEERYEIRLWGDSYCLQLFSLLNRRHTFLCVQMYVLRTELGWSLCLFVAMGLVDGVESDPEKNCFQSRNSLFSPFFSFKISLLFYLSLVYIIIIDFLWKTVRTIFLTLCQRRCCLALSQQIQKEEEARCRMSEQGR